MRRDEPVVRERRMDEIPEMRESPVVRVGEVGSRDLIAQLVNSPTLEACRLFDLARDRFPQVREIWERPATPTSN